MIRAGIYIRKSRQDKGQEGYRLELQRTQLPAIAQQKGWVPEIYDDGVISGTEVENRREMMRLIADVEKGHLQIVLCLEFSRLSRDESLQDFLSFLNLCAAKGVQLATPDRVLDPSDHASWFLAIMQGGFSAVEMKTLKKRLLEGRTQARKKGRWLGGIPPFGYAYDREKKLLIPRPEAAKVVTELFALRAKDGRSLDEIVQIARKRQWPTPRGGRWVSSTVSRLVANPIYKGLVRFQDQLVQAANEPLVDAPTWEAAQLTRQRPPGGRKPRLLLTGSGRVRCGYCGNPVNCAKSCDKKVNGEWGAEFLYYHCYGRHYGDPCRKLRNVRDFELDGLVLSILSQFARNKAEILSGIQSFLAKKLGALPERKRHLEAQLRHASTAGERLLKAYEDGAIALEQLKERNQAHKQQIADIQKSIVDLDLELGRHGGMPDLKTLEDRLARLQERLGRASVDELRDLVGPLISKVKLFNGCVEIMYSFPVQGKTEHVYALPKGIASDSDRPRPTREVDLRRDAIRELVAAKVLAPGEVLPIRVVALDRATPS